MRSRRHQNFHSRQIFPFFVIGANHRHTRELSLRTSHWRQGYRLHAGDIFKVFLKVIKTGQETLRLCFRRQWMTSQKTWDVRSLVRTSRVVFHGARAQ